MATIITVLKRRKFDYSYLAAGTSQLVVIQPAIEVHEYYTAHLFVRVHARSMSSGQSLDFGLHYTMPSDDDAREFTESSPFTSLTVTSTAPAVVPGLISRSVSDIGGYVKILMTVTQTSPSLTTLYAELSAELVLREA
jgi:hypothetical protein